MITSEKDIYLNETEIKPNRSACLVLAFTLGVVVICWLMNELGFFHVGADEMRIGTIITFIATMMPLLMVLTDRKRLASPALKYIVIAAASIFTFTVGTLLTFHTTIMLLFPILLAMLYRSKSLGMFATAASMVCTMIAPILGYLLDAWDIPLFQELILIGTNGGEVSVVGGGDAVSWVNIGKILLYLVLPRLMLIGSCALLLFNNIRIGVDHVNNQILLNRLSHVDALTGLYNQNCYKDFLQTEKSRGVCLGVIFFDVNGLKDINDKQGHEYGDRLLQRNALSLLNVCDNESAAAFRVGGDEFIIVMENATEERIRQKLAEWKQALDRINEENKRAFDGIICSMAVGYDMGNSADIEEIVRRADAFMYQNKIQMR